MTRAVAQLTAAFDTPCFDSRRADDPGRSVVVSWPSVPLEIVRAARLRPVVARGGNTAATPLADRHLEADIFPGRLRHLVEAALDGRLSEVAGVVLPRTSEPDYKCFLYLREFVRNGTSRTSAPVVLFNLLQSDSADARVYNVASARALLDELASASGYMPDTGELRREIARSNAARAAARRLAALRRGTPRVTGTEVLPLLGAFWQLPPERYASLANAAADALAARPPLAVPRVLVTGAPVDTTALHVTIESHGAVVVAEAGPWGNAAEDVAVDGDPVDALAAACRTGALGPRTPADVVRRWTERQLGDVDAVVVSLPPDDAVFGWDYPALRDRLAARGIPHVCLRGNLDRAVAAEDHADLDALVARARLQEARHG